MSSYVANQLTYLDDQIPRKTIEQQHVAGRAIKPVRAILELFLRGLGTEQHKYAKIGLRSVCMGELVIRMLKCTTEVHHYTEMPKTFTAATTGW